MKTEPIQITPGYQFALFMLPVLALYLFASPLYLQAGFFADNAVYLMMTDNMSPWQDIKSAAHEHIGAVSHFPPLYPATLALLGGSSVSIVWTKLLSSLFFVLSFLGFRSYLNTVKLSPAERNILSASLALAPVSVLMSTDLWSEGLYLCFFWASLLLLESISRQDEKGLKQVLAACLLFVLCCLTRSAGIILLPAMALVLLAGKQFSTRERLANGALLVASIAATRLLGTRSSGGHYEDIFFEHYLQAGGFATYALNQLQAFASAFHYNLSLGFEPGVFSIIASILVFLLSLTGMLTSLKDHPVLWVSSLCYAGLVIIWPFPDVMFRLLYPLLPAILLAGWLGARYISRYHKALPLAALAIPLLLASGWVKVWDRYNMEGISLIDDHRKSAYWLHREQSPASLMEHRVSLDIYRHFADITGIVPADQCIYGLNMQAGMLNTHRIFLPPPKQEKLQDTSAYRCQWFYMQNQQQSAYPPFYPLEQLQEQVEITGIFYIDKAAGVEPFPVAILARLK